MWLSNPIIFTIIKKKNIMIKEWKYNFIFEFRNGYRVRIPYVKSTSIPIPTKPKFDVLGPNDEYLTPNFMNEKYGKNLDADDIIDILAKVKNIDPNEDINIL